MLISTFLRILVPMVATFISLYLCIIYFNNHIDSFILVPLLVCAFFYVLTDLFVNMYCLNIRVYLHDEQALRYRKAVESGLSQNGYIPYVGEKFKKCYHYKRGKDKIIITEDEVFNYFVDPINPTKNEVVLYGLMHYTGCQDRFGRVFKDYLTLSFIDKIKLKLKGL